MMRRSLLAFAAILALTAPIAAHDHSAMNEAAPSGASLFNLTSRWTDQDGRGLDLKDLRGRRTVVAMGYTSCPDICPLIVANMAAIEKAAKAKGLDLRFAFVTLDPKVDTPERLKAYADAHGLDSHDWILLHGDDRAVRGLAAVLGVRYRANGEGGFDHSAIITLLNEQGEILYQKPDMQVDPEDFITHIPR
jgi:protein SCO1/2